MNNAPRKKFTLKQRVVITIVATIVALPVLLIIYTLSGALPWRYYFSGKQLEKTWPDNEVAILVAGADSNNIYWPRSGKSYTFNGALKIDSRQRTFMSIQKRIWVYIEHSYQKFVVTNPRLKTGLWKDVDGPTTCFTIYDHKAYTLSPSAVELFEWPLDYNISGHWMCIRKQDTDGRTITTLYRYGARNRRLYREYRDTYGWLMGNHIVLVAGDGSVTHTDLDTWKSHDIGSLGTKRNPRSFVASGSVFMNGSSVYRYEGDQVKKISVIRPRNGEIGRMFNEVSIIDGFIIHKYLYNLTYIAGFDVYRAGSSDLVAATVKGVDISYAISSDDAKLLIDIDRHGLKNARYIP